MAICADWRVGIESRILDKLSHLDKDLRLAGLTAGILHGKSVLLLLGYRQGGPGPVPTAQAKAAFAGPGSHDNERPVIYLDRWQRRSELGAIPALPLLRVHLRVADRSGATLAILDALHTAIAEAAPGIFDTDDWNVWYAKAAAKNGKLAEIQLTIMLPDGQPCGGSADVTSWGSLDYAKIERRALELVAHKAAVARQAGLAPAGPHTSWDTVIRLGLIEIPEWSPPASKR